MLLGAVFFVTIFYACILVLRKLAVLAVRKCGDNWATRRIRRNQNIPVVVTRFLLEGCVEIGMSAMISVIMIEKETFQNGWEVIAILCAFLSLILLLLMPIFFLKIRPTFLEAVREAGGDRSASRYAPLFEEYRVDKSALLYPVVFFLRRYLMIIILTTMPSVGFAQIFTQMYATVFVIQYLWRVFPFENTFLNRQEIINECTVLCASYPLLTFTSFLRDEDRRIEFGWVVVAIILFNLFFNIAVLVVQLTRQNYRRIKFWYIRRQKRKEIKLRLEAIHAR